MDMLEKLLLVARDAAPFYEYNYQFVVEQYKKKRRRSNLRSQPADKGKRRKGDDGESVDVDIEEVVPPVKDRPDDSFLIQTQLLPLILPMPILEVQILVQILTQALIQTKTDDHEMVTPILIGLHVIWDQLQGGGSPSPPPLKHSPGFEVRSTQHESEKVGCKFRPTPWVVAGGVGVRSDASHKRIALEGIGSGA